MDALDEFEAALRESDVLPSREEADALLAALRNALYPLDTYPLAAAAGKSHAAAAPAPPDAPPDASRDAARAVSWDALASALRTLASPPPGGAGAKSLPPFTGLVNQGGTCYLNSLLQALYFSAPFRDAVFAWRHDAAVHGEEADCLVAQLQRLFLELCTSLSGAVDTTRLTKAFGWTSDDAFTQHDVQELCRVLFDAIDQVDGGGGGGGAPGVLAAATRAAFTGSVQDDITCAACGTVRSRMDAFSDLELSVLPPPASHATGAPDATGAVPAGSPPDATGAAGAVPAGGGPADAVQPRASIADALSAYCAPEAMSGSEAVQCDVCGGRRAAVKQLSLRAVPPLLMLHLKRFAYDAAARRFVKLTHAVDVPLTLDMARWTGAPAPQPYELYAVMMHAGGVASGHYYAFVRAPHGMQLHTEGEGEAAAAMQPDAAGADAGAPPPPRSDSWLLFNDTHVAALSSAALQRILSPPLAAHLPHGDVPPHPSQPPSAAAGGAVRARGVAGIPTNGTPYLLFYREARADAPPTAPLHIPPPLPAGVTPSSTGASLAQLTRLQESYAALVRAGGAGASVQPSPPDVAGASAGADVAQRNEALLAGMRVRSLLSRLTWVRVHAPDAWPRAGVASPSEEALLPPGVLLLPASPLPPPPLAAHAALTLWRVRCAARPGAPPPPRAAVCDNVRLRRYDAASGRALEVLGEAGAEAGAVLAPGSHVFMETRASSEDAWPVYDPRALSLSVYRWSAEMGEVYTAAAEAMADGAPLPPHLARILRALAAERLVLSFSGSEVEAGISLSALHSALAVGEWRLPVLLQRIIHLPRGLPLLADATSLPAHVTPASLAGLPPDADVVRACAMCPGDALVVDVSAEEGDAHLPALAILRHLCTRDALSVYVNCLATPALLDLLHELRAATQACAAACRAPATEEDARSAATATPALSMSPAPSTSTSASASSGLPPGIDTRGMDDATLAAVMAALQEEEGVYPQPQPPRPSPSPSSTASGAATPSHAGGLGALPPPPDVDFNVPVAVRRSDTLAAVKAKAVDAVNAQMRARLADARAAASAALAHATAAAASGDGDGAPPAGVVARVREALAEAEEAAEEEEGWRLDAARVHCRRALKASMWRDESVRIGTLDIGDGAPLLLAHGAPLPEDNVILFPLLALPAPPPSSAQPSAHASRTVLLPLPKMVVSPGVGLSSLRRMLLSSARAAAERERLPLPPAFSPQHLRLRLRTTPVLPEHVSAANAGAAGGAGGAGGAGAAAAAAAAAAPNWLPFTPPLREDVSLRTALAPLSRAASAATGAASASGGMAIDAVEVGVEVVPLPERITAASLVLRARRFTPGAASGSAAAGPTRPGMRTTGLRSSKADGTLGAPLDLVLNRDAKAADLTPLLLAAHGALSAAHVRFAKPPSYGAPVTAASAAQLKWEAAEGMSGSLASGTILWRDDDAAAASIAASPAAPTRASPAASSFAAARAAARSKVSGVTSSEGVLINGAGSCGGICGVRIKVNTTPASAAAAAHVPPTDATPASAAKPAASEE